MFYKYSDINDLISDLKSDEKVFYEKGRIVRISLESADINTVRNVITIFVDDYGSFFQNTQRYIYSYAEFKQLTFSKHIYGVQYFLSISPVNTIATWNLLSIEERDSFEDIGKRLITKPKWDFSWNLPTELVPKIEVTQNTVLIPSGGSSNFISETIVDSVTKIFTIHNKGTASLLINAPATIENRILLNDPDDKFSILQPTQNRIEPNSSLTFSITYQPSAILPINASILILSNDTSTPAYVISLLGSVKHPISEFEVSRETTDPERVLFYSLISENSEKTIAIKNIGTKSLEILSVALVGDEFSIITPATSPILVNGETTLLIRFSSLVSGKFTGTLSIETDDSESPIKNFDLIGFAD